MALSEKCKAMLGNVARAARNMFNNPHLDRKAVMTSFAKTSVDSVQDPSLRQVASTVVRNNYLSATATFFKNLGGNMGRLIELPLARLVSGRPMEAVAIIEGYAGAFWKTFPRFIGGFANKNIEFDGRTGQNMDVYFKIPLVDRKHLDLINKPINAIATFPQSLQRGVDEGFAVMLEQAQYEVMKHRIKHMADEDVLARFGMDKHEFVDQMDEILKLRDKNYRDAVQTIGSDLTKEQKGEVWAKVKPLWQMMESISPQMASEMEDFARYGVFRQRLGDSFIDQSTRKIAEMVTKSPELALILPFVVTPVNIAKFGFGYVPGIGLLRSRPDFGNLLTKGKLVLKDIQKYEEAISKREAKLAEAIEKGSEGAIERLNKEIGTLKGRLQFERDFNRDLIAQQILGAGFVGSAYYMKQNDMLTGEYSNDPAKRRVQEEAGFQPNSIKVGGKWVSYAGIEPLHTVLSMTATAMDQIQESMIKGEDMTERIFRVGNVIKAGFLSKTFTEQLANAMSAIQSDNHKKIQQFVVNMSNGLVPNVLNELARIEDPIRREIRDPEMVAWIMNNMKSRIPSYLGGGRQELPASVSLLGAERQLPSTASQVSGFPVKKADRTVVEELMNNPELRLMPVSNKVAGVELTPEQYNRLATQSGQMLNILVEALATSEGFLMLPKSLQAKFIQDYASSFRRDARLAMIPEIIQDPAQREAYQLQELLKNGINPYTYNE